MRFLDNLKETLEVLELSFNGKNSRICFFPIGMKLKLKNILQPEHNFHKKICVFYVKADYLRLVKNKEVRMEMYGRSSYILLNICLMGLSQNLNLYCRWQIYYMVKLIITLQ